MINKKGQAFESFRLLIAFVLALAMLFVIMNMINMNQEKSIIISQEKLNENIKSATRSAGISNQIPYKIEDLMLTGYIRRQELQNVSGVSRNCFSLQGGPGFVKEPNFDLRIEGKYLKTNVIIYCDFVSNRLNLNSEIASMYISDLADCEEEVFCVLFFNKDAPDNLFKNSLDE